MKLRVDPITAAILFITLLAMFGSFIGEHERQASQLEDCRTQQTESVSK